MLPKRLVFCGGGTRCLVFLQTLVEFHARGMLVDANEYWGTSAGALLAALMALLDGDPHKVKDLMFQTEYSRFRDIDVTNVLAITTTWGMDDGKSLVRTIEELFETAVAGSKDTCMRDLPGLHIVVADLTIHETVVVNSVSYPDLRVVDAIRASMSLPLFFRPYIHRPSGHFWVDGAVRANFPWDLLPSDDARREALGFAFETPWIGGPRTFSEYLFSMIHFDEPKKRSELKTAWNGHIVWYPTPPFPAWFMKLNERDFRLIESYGSDACARYLTLLSEPPKTPEDPPEHARPHMAPPTSPQDHTDELLDTPRPCLEPAQGSFRLQSQQSPRAFRRWSV